MEIFYPNEDPYRAASVAYIGMPFQFNGSFVLHNVTFIIKLLYILKNIVSYFSRPFCDPLF